jgi:putative methyltransferase (TIGR04325 family)
MGATDIKDWLPPKLVPILRRFGHQSLQFEGEYNSWDAAVSSSNGYSQSSILRQVASATRRVLAGEAAYDRDGFVFEDVDYSYPLVCMLMHASLLNAGKLNVIDFGGALGSTYRQCLPLLDCVPQLLWQVIEQEHYVDLGKFEFEDQCLSFHKRLEDTTVDAGSKRVLLLSSVIQYLRYPEVEIRRLISHDISHVIIDRTPMHDVFGHKLYVQRIPKKLGGGSYPCWILSKPEILKLFPRPWKLLAEFPCLDGRWRSEDGLNFEYRGLCFVIDKNA